MFQELLQPVLKALTLLQAVLKVMQKPPCLMDVMMQRQSIVYIRQNSLEAVPVVILKGRRKNQHDTSKIMEEIYL
jgi:hypothetical protein